MFQLVHDTMVCALSNTDSADSIEQRAVVVGAEVAAVTKLPQALCVSAVFSALVANRDLSAAARVAHTLTAPLRV
jgi:hypothetical protein